MWKFVLSLIHTKTPTLHKYISDNLKKKYISIKDVTTYELKVKGSEEDWEKIKGTPLTMDMQDWQ